MSIASCRHVVCAGQACLLIPAAPTTDPELHTLRDELARRELAQLGRVLLVRVFAAFVERFFVDVAGCPYVPNVASDAIIRHLQAVADGQISRLAISTSPASGKSTLLVLFGAWLLLRRPQARSIHASHALDLARRDSARTRRLIESDAYRALVAGAWTLRDDANRLDHFETTAGGHRIALGVGGALTGLRAGSGGVIAIDDSLNAVDARSKAVRDAVNDWFDQAVSTRLDPGDGGIVLVQQRLHSQDLIGHALELGGFESLILPSEYDSSRRCVTSVWSDPRTVDGALLAPEIHSADFLAEQKRILGTAGYAAQYLCNPTDDEGGLFKREAWRYWKPDGTAPTTSRRPAGAWDGPAVPLPDRGRVLVSLDATFKDAATSDNVCFLVILAAGAERYVLERRHGKMSFTRTCEVLQELAEAYRGAVFLVEDKANGSAILDALKKVVPNMLGISPRESKEARAAAVSPAVSGGQVYLPDGAPWLGDFIEEAASFPLGKHDDQVDALSQALAWAVAELKPSVWDHFRARNRGGHGGGSGGAPAGGGFENIARAILGDGPATGHYRERIENVRGK
jgi:predicted phage terminase large subunit-like protein